MCRMWAFGLLLAIATSPVAMPAVVYAQQAQKANDRPLPLVLTVIRGRLGLEPVVSDLLQDQRLSVTVADDANWDPQAILRVAGKPEDDTVRVWIDLRNPEEAQLFFWQPGRERFSLRRVGLPSGLDAVGRESIGIVLRVAVDALIAGTAFDLTPVEMARILTPEPEPPTAPAPAVQAKTVAPSPRTLKLEAAVLYGLRAFAPGDAAVLHGPGLGLALRPPTGGVEAHVHLQYQFGAQRKDEPSGLVADFRTFTALLGAGFAPTRAPGLFVSVAQFAGVDLTFVQPRATDPLAVVPEAASTIWTPLVRPCVTVGYVSRRLWSQVFFFADLDLLGTRYQLKAANGARTLVEPWRVRPGFALAVGLR